MALSQEDIDKYPVLAKYSAPLRKPERDILGREKEIESLMAALMRPELSNVMLLAPAGSGKTMLVQGAMLTDVDRIYLEVDLVRMISDLANADEMAARLKALFDDAERYGLDEKRELVLFIDEFHQVVQLSAAAVEALKPVLAASGTRGIKVIAATTYDEFDLHIRPNQPLVERLQRINLSPPGKDVVIDILRAMAERYEVSSGVLGDHLYEQIYEITERYIPASSQPRKSILVLDSMVGWHRLTGRELDMKLLAEVLQESQNINISFNLDATSIQEKLDSVVFSQKFATGQVARRLQLCVADLHDKSKPLASFLFTGSTGVGKSQLVKELALLLYGDNTDHLVRFDMSEYSNDDTLDAFRSSLTSRAWAMGHSVILFDEIEKASGKVVRLLLQLLDDGRLTDDNGRQVSFLNSYIVLTTNAGSEIYKTIAQYNADDEGSGEGFKSRMKEIRRSLVSTQGENRFPPELLGRIDAIVPFQPLTRETQLKIVKAKTHSFVKEVYAKHGVKVNVDKRVYTYLIEDKAETDSDAGGAREAIRRLTDEVFTEVAAYVNHNPENKNIVVAVVGNLVSENKNIRESDAKIVVDDMANFLKKG